MKLFQIFALNQVAESLELNGHAVYVRDPANIKRTFVNLESYAADIFNKDPMIKEMRLNSTYPYAELYNAETWTNEFMEYGCYCNKVVRGGGRLPGGTDLHEKTCIDLYACYKCINIDYDHTGTYAAEKMVYNAEISDNNELVCLDELTHRKRRSDGHDHEHINQEDCPRHVCECDKEFVRKILANHQLCLLNPAGGSCVNDAFRHMNDGNNKPTNFVPKEMCEFIGEHTKEIDECCGEYPNRIPFFTDDKICCDGKLKLDTVC